jgi:hypothetical protein
VEYEHRSANDFERMDVINAFVDAIKTPPHKVQIVLCATLLCDNSCEPAYPDFAMMPNVQCCLCIITSNLHLYVPTAWLAWAPQWWSTIDLLALALCCTKACARLCCLVIAVHVDDSTTGSRHTCTAYSTLVYLIGLTSWPVSFLIWVCCAACAVQVNLTKPTKTVLVQVTRNVCGFAVVERYKELNKFNLRKCAEVSSPLQGVSCSGSRNR